MARNKMGRPHGTSLLSPEEAAEIYVRYQKGEGSLVLGRAFDCSDQTVRNVVRFKGVYGSDDFKPLMLSAWKQEKKGRKR